MLARLQSGNGLRIVKYIGRGNDHCIDILRKQILFGTADLGSNAGNGRLALHLSGNRVIGGSDFHTVSKCL